MGRRSVFSQKEPFQGPGALQCGAQVRMLLYTFTHHLSIYQSTIQHSLPPFIPPSIHAHIFGTSYVVGRGMEKVVSRGETKFGRGINSRSALGDITEGLHPFVLESGGSRQKQRVDFSNFFVETTDKALPRYLSKTLVRWVFHKNEQKKNLAAPHLTRSPSTFCSKRVIHYIVFVSPQTICLADAPISGKRPYLRETRFPILAPVVETS